MARKIAACIVALAAGEKLAPSEARQMAAYIRAMEVRMPGPTRVRVPYEDLRDAIEAEFVGGTDLWVVGPSGAVIPVAGGFGRTTEPNKIGGIKLIRELTDLGLCEAKDLIESAPFQLPCPEHRIDEVRARLEACGYLTEMR